MLMQQNSEDDYKKNRDRSSTMDNKGERKQDARSPEVKSPGVKRNNSITLNRQASNSSNFSNSSQRARQSKKMRKSIESMGSSVKSASLLDDGIMVQSDLSMLNFKDSYRDRSFWHIWTMITFSMMYAFFMKVAFKSYGSTIYSDDVYLTNTAKIGFLTAAVSRFGWAALQEVLGFKRVYTILLVL